MTAAADSARDEEPDHSPRYRRILVALEPASEHTRLAHRAALLAARLQTDLMGLFVQAPELSVLAKHATFPLFLSAAGGLSDSADGALLRRALKAGAQRCRITLESAARDIARHDRQHGVVTTHVVRTTFEIREGQLGQEVSDTADTGDLVLVEQASPAVSRDMIDGAPGPVLLLHPATDWQGPLAVIYDGTEQADRALATAQWLMATLRPKGRRQKPGGGELDILMPTQRIDDARAWETRIRERLHDATITLTFLHMPGAGLADLGQATARYHAGVMIIGADQRLAREPEAPKRLQRLPCSVLLVR